MPDAIREALQVGGSKDFDPEVYRQQIRDYTSGKVESQRKAYFGAGNILSHHGVSHMPPMRGHQKALPSTVAECMMTAPASVAGSGTHHAPSEAGNSLLTQLLQRTWKNKLVKN